MNAEEVRRRRVEIVLGLTGGELHEPHPDFPDPWDGEWMWWYEGKPGYAEDLPAQEDCPDCGGTYCDDCNHSGAIDAEYRTGIHRVDLPPEKLAMQEKCPDCDPDSGDPCSTCNNTMGRMLHVTWELVKTYTSSGETECPCDYMPRMVRAGVRALPDRAIRAAKDAHPVVWGSEFHEDFTGEMLCDGELLIKVWEFCATHPQARDDARTQACPLCEDDGHIYIGDGWYEAVYRRLRG